MKKRVSSLFLAVCITLTTCSVLSAPAKADFTAHIGIWEEGATSWADSGVSLPMYEEGALPSGSGNGWRYDGPSHTLTLHNFRGERLMYSSSSADTVPLTIVLEGNNTIAWTQNDSINGALEIDRTVITRGSGMLTVTGGIRIRGDLTLESGVIVTTGTKDTHFRGLEVDGVFTVRGGSLTAAPGGGTESNAGIKCNKLVMTGGKVATTRTDEYTYTKDEYSYPEGVEPSDKSESPYTGLSCSDGLNISGGELSVTGQISTMEGTIEATDNMNITCTLKGQGTQSFPMGFVPYGQYGEYSMLKPLDENFRHLPITSITFTSDDASSSSIPAPGVPDLTASPSASTVLLNGQSIVFDAYTINGNNYFKLRDLAYALSGTNKQFDVSWDGEANAIALTSGQPYTPVGGELASKGSQIQTPVPSLAKVYLDGAEVALTAYTIQGNNYFKLRDLASVLDFGVDWDGANNAVVIDTAKSYTPDQVI